MNIHSHLDKLRRKPERERRKIAVIATGVAFSAIFLIWVASFSEMNRETENTGDETGSASVSDQIESMQGGLDDGAESGGQSIEEMMQGFSADEAGAAESADEGSQAQEQAPAPVPDTSGESVQQEKPEIPDASPNGNISPASGNNPPAGGTIPPLP